MKGIVHVIAALLATSLTGCGTLLYGERTGFNLGIYVNDELSRPIEVNAGLKRSVGVVAPPLGESEDGTPQTEAVSMFSGFDLGRERGQGPLQGKLFIATAFATGAAALELAGDVETVDQITGVQVSEFALGDPSVATLRCWLHGDDAGRMRLEALKSWVSANAADAGLTAVRFGKDQRVKREAAIADLGVTCPQGAGS